MSFYEYCTSVLTPYTALTGLHCIAGEAGFKSRISKNLPEWIIVSTRDNNQQDSDVKPRPERNSGKDRTNIAWLSHRSIP